MGDGQLGERAQLAARAWFQAEPWPLRQLVALLAGQRDPDPGAAVGVPHDGRRALRAREVAVAPVHEREQDRDQLAPGPAEPVLVPLARARLTVGGALDQAGLGQPGEPVRQHVPRDAEVAGQLVEAADAVGHVAQHEQRPAVADKSERPGDRAGVAVVRAIRPHDRHRTRARLLLETQMRERVVMTTAPGTEAADTAADTATAQPRERTFSWDDPVAIARAGAGLSGVEF